MQSSTDQIIPHCSRLSAVPLRVVARNRPSLSPAALRFPPPSLCPPRTPRCASDPCPAGERAERERWGTKPPWPRKPSNRASHAKNAKVVSARQTLKWPPQQFRVRTAPKQHAGWRSLAGLHAHSALFWPVTTHPRSPKTSIGSNQVDALMRAAARCPRLARSVIPTGRVRHHQHQATPPSQPTPTPTVDSERARQGEGAHQLRSPPPKSRPPNTRAASKSPTAPTARIDHTRRLLIRRVSGPWLDPWPGLVLAWSPPHAQPDRMPTPVTPRRSPFPPTISPSLCSLVTSALPCLLSGA